MAACTRSSNGRQRELLWGGGDKLLFYPPPPAYEGEALWAGAVLSFSPIYPTLLYLKATRQNAVRFTPRRHHKSARNRTAAFPTSTCQNSKDHVNFLCHWSAHTGVCVAQRVGFREAVLDGGLPL